MKSKNIKKNNKKEKQTKEKNNMEEYGYDFVAELAHFTNIDEQKKTVEKLEKL